jgi:hypothetical protein
VTYSDYEEIRLAGKGEKGNLEIPRIADLEVSALKQL